MTKFEWWVGGNDEFLNIAGPLASREEAIAAGEHDRPGEPFYICRAGLHEWRAPDAASVMDQWVEGHDELWFEDGFGGFDGPNASEREKAAEADLQEVLNAWFVRHKAMLPTATAFAWHTDGEWFNLAESPPAASSGSPLPEAQRATVADADMRQRER